MVLQRKIHQYEKYGYAQSVFGQNKKELHEIKF